MQARRVAPALFVAGFVIASVAAAQAGETRAVLELFTSQGCSSCPPADRLVGQFANDPSVVALSVPIDYWDYLGWRDTLANPAHSARQRAYARVRGDEQVYTPQIVVNGSADALGSDQGAIERAIVQTDHKTGVMSLPVVLAVNNGTLDVSVSDGDKAPAASEVWLCPLAKSGLGGHRSRREPRPHHHLPQCGAQLAQAWSAQRRPVELERADRPDQSRRHRRRRGHGAGRQPRSAGHHSWRRAD